MGSLQHSCNTYNTLETHLERTSKTTATHLQHTCNRQPRHLAANNEDTALPPSPTPPPPNPTDHPRHNTVTATLTVTDSIPDLAPIRAARRHQSPTTLLLAAMMTMISTLKYL